MDHHSMAQKIREFAEFHGFRHGKITPEHLQANSQVEKLMFKIGEVIRNSIIEKKLNNFLRSYRSTPHISTGVASSILYLELTELTAFRL